MRTTLVIDKLDCPTEERLIRGALARLAGIAAVEFNLVRRTLELTHTPEALTPTLAALEQLGLPGRVLTEGPVTARASAQIKTSAWPLVASGMAAASAELVQWWLGAHWIVIVLALLAILTGGLPTYRKGWIALRHLNLNMNALMSLAVTGAMLIGQWPEAAMVMFLFALAEVIEAKSLDRARDAIHSLMGLAPDRATVQQEDGTWRDVPAEVVPIDARVRAKPGERIALDGIVLAGRSTVNQAPITGESLPMEKAEGDLVFAGSINGAAALEYRVTAPASSSTLARIIHAVESAEGSRAPTQRFVDRFARIYTPAVFAVAIGVAVAGPLALGGPWLEWIYRALVLLVIACPCALVISTPVTIVSGLAAAARHGILIKGGTYLESGRHLATLALDKTGTLTHGKPAQTDSIPWPVSDVWPEAEKTRVRMLAASLAARSDHPIALAIAQAARAEGLRLREVAGFEALPGRGVLGTIGHTLYVLGNHRLIEELGRCDPALEAALDRLERQGKSVVVLLDPGRALGLFAVADTVREASCAAIAELHGLGVRTVLLTGDNPHTAEAIAREVGIDDVRSNLLPEHKLDAIDGLRRAGGPVGMVGDGINDALALAKADIGFAMGAAGTDTAIETAAIALMDDDLRKVPWFIRHSRRTAAILMQNIALALGIKAAFLILTIFGHATMWMAVFADMGTSLLVVLNGMRLLRQ